MIEVLHIRKSYGKKTVLKDVSFCAMPGECVVFVGRNGCGKSTLLQILAGALRPDSGDITCFGDQPLRRRALFRKYCGYVPQENPLMEELTVLDNLRLWGFRKSHPDVVILQQFGLEDLLNRNVESLSGGMKRRVSIACAAMMHPPVMLLDEPTNALDICYREEFYQWLSLYQQYGGIVLMTTHEESEIMNAQRCMVMNNGRLFELKDTERNMKSILNLTEEETTK